MASIQSVIWIYATHKNIFLIKHNFEIIWIKDIGLLFILELDFVRKFSSELILHLLIVM